MRGDGRVRNELVLKKDPILEFFVQAANNRGFTLDLTLQIEGCLITGTLMSAKDYFMDLSEGFEDSDDITQAISKQMASASEEAGKSGKEEANYIHLKHADIYYGDSNPIPQSGVRLWRGKLSEVKGFFLGRITNTS